MMRLKLKVWRGSNASSRSQSPEISKPSTSGGTPFELDLLHWLLADDETDPAWKLSIAETGHQNRQKRCRHGEPNVPTAEENWRPG